MDVEQVKSPKSKITGASGSRLGEIVESSSSQYTAQCYKLEEAPPLGSLVKTREKAFDVYGVVYNVVTHSLEPGRRVIARGEKLETEAEIFAANPQLTRLLATDFSVLVVGYVEGKHQHQFLPPKSSSIHGFVHICQRDEISAFTQSLDFLSLLLNARISLPVDEVVAACVRQCSSVHDQPDAFLIKAGKELTRMLSGDVNRLNSLLKRLK